MWVRLMTVVPIFAINHLPKKSMVRDIKAISKFESKHWMDSTVGIQGWVPGEKYFLVYAVIYKRPVSKSKIRHWSRVEPF